MLDDIYNSFKEDVPISHLANCLEAFEYLMDHFNIAYMKDENARKIAINSVMQMLSKIRDKK